MNVKRMVDRRALLAFFALGAPPLLMGSQCAQNINTIATVGAQLVADVQGIAGGLAAQFPGIASALTAGTATQVQGDLTTLGSLASTVSTALTQNAAQPIVSQVVSVVQDIASVAGPLLPPPWGLAVSAAVSLLPVLAQGVGLVIGSLAGPQAGGMTPDAARAVLGIKTVA